MERSPCSVTQKAASTRLLGIKRSLATLEANRTPLPVSKHLFSTRLVTSIQPTEVGHSGTTPPPTVTRPPALVRLPATPSAATTRPTVPLPSLITLKATA